MKSRAARWRLVALGVTMMIGCKKDELRAKDAHIAELEAQGQQVEETLTQCREDRANLDKLVAGITADAAQFKSQLEATEAALAAAAGRQERAGQRIATYRSMLAQLESMIDSGQLQVRVVRNRMVVELPEAVLFASGSARLKKGGEEVLVQLAPVLVGLEDQLFQVGGHTDNVPIRTARFPSNWELAAARAVNVTRLMVKLGMSAQRISAAAYADTQPVASNDTKDGRAQNRRIEIALLPALDELPDLSALENFVSRAQHLTDVGFPVLALGLALAAVAGCTVIEDGEVGVVMRFGEIADEPLLPGFTARFPVVRSIEKWNVKLEELKETASVPSSEGMVVGLDASLLYRVKPSMAPRIRKTVGLRYRETLIVPLFRSEIRKVAAGQPVRDMYSEEGREQMSESVMSNLRDTLGPEGVEIVNVLLRDVKLPQRFKDAIEAKLTAEQKVQQKQFELQQAEKDAEIEVARARGAAESQKIVRSTLSESYLHYLWIKTLNENPDVIYVATEANLPMFKAVK